jgi:hypothetical protein
MIPEPYWKKISLVTLKLTLRGLFLSAALKAFLEDSTAILPGCYK